MLTAFSLPLSNFGMSLGQFLMAGGWLLAANLKERASQTFRHPVFVLPAILFLIQLAGLLNTSDLDWGLHDLRVKLPILLVPLLLVSGPGMDQRFKANTLYMLFAGLLAATIIGMFRVLTGEVTLNDFRSMSPFISHIRLSLLLVFSIAAIPLLYNRKMSFGMKFLSSSLALWFLVYINLLQSLTGLAILAVLALVCATYGIFRSGNKILRIPLMLLLLTGTIAGFMLVRYVMIDSLVPEKADPEDLEQFSALGSPYRHDTDRIETENGRFVWTEYSETELDSAWALRSSVPLLKTDSAGRFPQATLMRYLTYLGYTKDFEGVSSLSDSQIEDIEHGYATPLHAKARTGLQLRVRELAREYRIYHYTGFAQGHTFAQRLEYQRAAFDIICRYPWTGVGTGDLPQAYSEAYGRINTSLEPAWQLRAHNQFLSIAVANGLWALAFMVFLMAFLLIRTFRKGYLLQAVFLVIAILSFLTEDTLETQAGVTFFAFLCCLLEGWGLNLWKEAKT